MRPGTWFAFTIALATAAFLVGGTASAQLKPVSADEQQNAVQLEKNAQRVNASAEGVSTPRGHQRVVMALAQDFKVSEDTVTALREQRKLGYGEIAIALGLAGELAKRDQTSIDTALAKIMARREAGLGWGRIAHEEGLKLGRVVSDVKRAEKAVENVQKLEKAEGKHERADKQARPDTLEKPEKLEKTERPEKPEKISKIERPQRPERVERPGKH